MSDLILYCPIHPKEQIICLSKNPSEKKLLFCVHCILQAPPQVKDHLITFKEGLEEVFNKLYSKSKLVIDDSALDSLLEAFDTKNDAVGKLTDHITKEKQRVCEELDSLLKDMTDVIATMKNDILQGLDAQIKTLKDNYAAFRHQLKKYSDFDNGRRKISSLTEFNDELNRCDCSDAFEQRWRDLIADLRDSNMYSVYGNKAKRVLTDKLDQYKTMIESGQKVYPKSFVGNGIYYETAKNELAISLRNFSTRAIKTESQLLKHEDFLKCINLTGSLNSQVLHSYDLPLLEEMSGGPIYDMSLQYRVSRDGPNLESVKKLLDSPENCLILIKTTNNQVIGFRKIVKRETAAKTPSLSKTLMKTTVFSLATQTKRSEEKYYGGSGSFWKNNNDEWPSKYLRIQTPVELRTDNGIMEICPALDGKNYFRETFCPREIEVYTVM